MERRDPGGARTTCSAGESRAADVRRPGRIASDGRSGLLRWWQRMRFTTFGRWRLRSTRGPPYPRYAAPLSSIQTSSGRPALETRPGGLAAKVLYPTTHSVGRRAEEVR